MECGSLIVNLLSTGIARRFTALLLIALTLNACSGDGTDNTPVYSPTLVPQRTFTPSAEPSPTLSPDLYPPSQRVGIEALDKVLARLERRDAQSLASDAVFLETPCGMPVTGSPPCGTNALGTRLPAFQFGSCSGGAAHNRAELEEGLRRVMELNPGLLAVVELLPERPEFQAGPAFGRYAIITRSGRENQEIIFHLDESGALTSVILCGQNLLDFFPAILPPR